MKKTRLYALTLVAGLLVTPLVAPAPTYAQMCGAANCTGVPGSGINCTVMITGMGCGGTGFVGVQQSMSAVCMFSGLVATAVHNPGSGAASPACTFTYTFGMATISITPTFSNSVTLCSPSPGYCEISMADGLPVELMEFSVEPEESDEGEAEDPETDDG